MIDKANPSVGTEEWFDETARLMRESAKQSLTPAERHAQRVSFAVSGMGRRSKMSRDDIQRLVDEQYA